MTKRTNEGTALTDIVLETFRLNGELLEAGNRITHPHGLTSARWQVMGAIDIAGQPLTVSQIARRMGLSRQGVQRIINDLVKLGMVCPKDNVDHVRAPLFSISKAGAEAMEKIDLAQAEWANALSDGIEIQELVRALEILQRVRERSEKLK